MMTVNHNGIERGLGFIPSTAAAMARLIQSGVVRLNSSRLLSARSTTDFEDVSCAHQWTYRKDQGSTSMCTAFSGSHVMDMALKKMGFGVNTSPASLYGPICGGRDGGAMIADAADILFKVGVFESGFGGLSDWDWRAVYRSRFWVDPTSAFYLNAQKHCLLEWVFLGDDVDAFVNAILSNSWVGQFALGVRRNSANFTPDRNGSLPKCDGSGLNHALFATGGYRHNPETGDLELEGGNSWGTGWGLDGLFYFDPWDWLDHWGQELWICRTPTVPVVDGTGARNTVN